jgi:hypothetical protein
MPLSRKIGVAFIFWLGALCCVCGAVRLALLHQTLHPVTQNPNSYATLTTMMIWAVAEPNVSVLAASLPTLRPLVNSGHESFIKPWFSTIGLSFKSLSGGSKQENSHSNQSGVRIKSPTMSDDAESTRRLHQSVELRPV